MAKFIKYKWRIYADNNISREIVDHLRQSDMDVLWIAEEPDLFLDSTKIKMNTEGLVIRMVDHDTQKVSMESRGWKDLF